MSWNAARSSAIATLLRPPTLMPRSSATYRVLPMPHTYHALDPRQDVAPWSSVPALRSSRTDREIPARDVAIRLRFAGQAQQTLADDVALDLLATALDAVRRRGEDRAACLGVGEKGVRTGDVTDEI